MSGTELPFITVVMPVRNEERFIASTIEQLLQQDYPPDRYEILVADGMSDDSTRAIVARMSKRHPQIRLVDNVKRLSSAGRNLGFRQGRGEVFMVIDGHCFIPTSKLLSGISATIEKNGADCLGRAQPLDPPDITDFQMAVALSRSSFLGHGKGYLIYSSSEGPVSPVSHGAIYRREVFTKVGFVDEGFDACEDVEFNYRLEKQGFKTYMSPILTVKYYPRENLRALFRQMKRYGFGRGKFILKHPEALDLSTPIPAALVLGLAVLPVAGLFRPVLRRVLPLVYGAYLALVMLTAVRISWERGLRFFPHLVPIFLVIHSGLGLGFLSGLFNSLLAKIRLPRRGRTTTSNLRL